jgi:hypothetical protein
MMYMHKSRLVPTYMYLQRYPIQPRTQGLDPRSPLRKETLVGAGHVPPRFWVVNLKYTKGGVVGDMFKIYPEMMTKI